MTLESTLAVVLPLVTLVMGFALSQFSESRGRRYETARRAEDRAVAVDARRLAFQRETISAVQDAALRLARLTTQIQHEDLMASRSNSADAYGRQQLTHEVSEEHRQRLEDLTKYRVRLESVPLRTLVDECASLCSQVLIARDAGAAAVALGDAITACELLNSECGRFLAELH